MSTLRIAIIQPDLLWEDPQANRDKIYRMIMPLAGLCDAVFLPEMFTSGFTINASAVAEKFHGPTLKWMQATSKDLNILLGGSYIIEEDKFYYNRFVITLPDDRIYYYDKRHLFRMAKENSVFTNGDDKVIFNYLGWNIRPLVCYDLRFPVWSRNVENNGKLEFDLLVYVANWPSKRSTHWRQLLIARAIENQCYVVGVNRVGSDGNDIIYSGDSALIDYLGEPLIQLRNNEQTCIVSISMSNLLTYRNLFPVWKDADTFIIS